MAPYPRSRRGIDTVARLVESFPEMLGRNPWVSSTGVECHPIMRWSENRCVACPARGIEVG